MNYCPAVQYSGGHHLEETFLSLQLRWHRFVNTRTIKSCAVQPAVCLLLCAIMLFFDLNFNCNAITSLAPLRPPCVMVLPTGTCAFWDQCWGSLACVPRKKTAQVEFSKGQGCRFIFLLFTLFVYACLHCWAAHSSVGVNKLPWNHTSDSICTASCKQTHTCRLRLYSGLLLYVLT